MTDFLTDGTGRGVLSVEPGQVFARKYEVTHILGSGAMGLVVAARHLHLDESVAIKFLLPETARAEGAAERFAREARAASKIRNEHVVRVWDLGQLPGGVLFMVMEHLEGEDLAKLIRRQGPLSLIDAVDYVLQACEAIAEAHARGIIHRDLKPSNLFLTRRVDGSVCIKVLDFGVSKFSKGETEITRSNCVVGSPYYMPPEQMASSREVDVRADIWSLGASLYELLVGHPPFSGEMFLEVCYNVSYLEPPHPRLFRAEIPEELENVILRSLRKDRAQRWDNVGELARALMPFASASGAASVAQALRVLDSLPPPPVAQGPRATVAPTVGEIGPDSRPRRTPSMSWSRLGGWVLGAGLLGVGALVVSRPVAPHADLVHAAGSVRRIAEMVVTDAGVATDASDAATCGGGGAGQR